MTAVILHCFSIKKKFPYESFLCCGEPMIVVTHAS